MSKLFPSLRAARLVAVEAAAFVRSRAEVDVDFDVDERQLVLRLSPVGQPTRDVIRVTFGLRWLARSVDVNWSALGAQDAEVALWFAGALRAASLLAERFELGKYGTTAYDRPLTNGLRPLTAVFSSDPAFYGDVSEEVVRELIGDMVAYLERDYALTYTVAAGQPEFEMGEGVTRGEVRALHEEMWSVCGA